MKQIWTLTKFRITIAMRNRAFLFFGIIIPVGLLFLFSAIFGGSAVPCWRHRSSYAFWAARVNG